MGTRLSSMVGACALLLALGGCSNETVKKVKAMADRACKCADAACADKVQKEYYDFAKAHAKVQGTQDERDEVQADYNRMNECVIKARTGGAAPEQGAAGGEAAPAAGGSPAGESPAPTAGKEAGK